MNWIDIALLFLFLVCVISDIRQGFIQSALSLCSWLGSLLCSLWFSGWLSGFLDGLFPSLGFWSAPLSFLILLILSRILIEIAANQILRQIDPSVHRHVINKILGAIPGVINGMVWTILLASVLALMPLTNSLSKSSHQSKLLSWALPKITWAEERLSPVFSDLLQVTVPSNSAALGKSESIRLPFHTDEASIRKDLEREMLYMVNNERKKAGLDTLAADPELKVVARKHSADMLSRGYFSHYTPEGITPFQRIRKEHLHFITAGENLAFAQTLALAHTGLMNSPGHRANILRPTFGRLGIGILDAGIYGLMITQNFRN